MYRSSDEWEQFVGEQVRLLRLRMNMKQKELASRAGVGVITISRIESGKGSSLSTLIKVLQVLRQDAWLEQLAPAASISPVQLHQLGKQRQRVR
jgi:transcriptional regulator with XRE-family HTH domain